MERPTLRVVPFCMTNWANSGYGLSMEHSRRVTEDPNAPSILGVNTKISKLCTIPDHQQGIRCKATRSDD